MKQQNTKGPKEKAIPVVWESFNAEKDEWLPFPHFICAKIENARKNNQEKFIIPSSEKFPAQEFDFGKDKFTMTKQNAISQLRRIDEFYEKILSLKPEKKTWIYNSSSNSTFLS